MKPLNYFREAVLSINTKNMPFYKENYPEFGEMVKRVLNEAQAAEKFILPNFGCILDGHKPYVPWPLNLPFPIIVIEYPTEGINVGNTNPIASAEKNIIIVKQVDTIIYLFQLSLLPNIEGDGKNWTFHPLVAKIPTVRTEGIENDTQYSCTYAHIDSGQFLNGMIEDPYFQEKTKLLLSSQKQGDKKPITMDTFISEISGITNRSVTVLFELLSALSCSNVNIEQKLTSAGSVRSAMKQKKGALPYDSYRILTLRVPKKKAADDLSDPEYDRSSPREHVRRGHIRHYKSGKTIWVNSMVVNAGVGGKVLKDYAIKKREQS